jgi:hypothetical protein
VIKRAMARVARAIATTMRVAGNKEANIKGGKGNGDDDKGVGQWTVTGNSVKEGNGKSNKGDGQQRG